jgi:hypothetical protein
MSTVPWETFSLRLGKADKEIVLRALRRGVVYAIFALVLYMFIVVVTTPNFAPIDSIQIAAGLNWWMIVTTSLGVGTQVFLITYAKERGCDLTRRKPLGGATGISAAFASFLSYLALIPVGCCGTWLYILSFLPGLVGVGVSSILIVHSRTIATIGLTLMALAITYTYLSLRRRLSAQDR